MYYINRELGVAINISRSSYFKKFDFEYTMREDGSIGTSYRIYYSCDGNWEELKFLHKSERDAVFASIMDTISKYNVMEMNV